MSSILSQAEAEMDSRRVRRVAIALAGVAALVATAAVWATTSLGLFADVLILLAVTGVATVLVGMWLVLRRMAMMADAIAHSILLGIVVMYFFVGDPGSPLFLIGAAGAGLLTVLITEALLATGLVREDAAMGMTFPLLFALALVIIALYLRDAHVDEHLVMAGGVEITVLRRVVIQDLALPAWLSGAIGGLLQPVLPAESVRVTTDGLMTIDGWDIGPRALWTMSAVLMVNLGFVTLFWKELKLTTFDAGLAASLGFVPVALNYALMALVSVTAVAAFEAVGSILVIALFIGPPAIAYLLTDDLAELVALSAIIAIAAALSGFLLGRATGANFGAAVAMNVGIGFILTLLAAPDQGLLAKNIRRRRQRRTFAEELLLVHLAHHEGTASQQRESDLTTLPTHLHWSADRTRAVVERLMELGEIQTTGTQLLLRDEGRSRAARVLQRR